jgi:hypoxanthine phosphoribosyltransferase
MVEAMTSICIFVSPLPYRRENINPLKMKTVKVLDKEFGLYIPQEKIEANVQKVADQINKDLEGQNPMFLVVLNGAFMFASELFKRITIPCEISFVKLTSYAGTESTSVVRELIGLDHSLEGRHVVVVEDIVDTGHTMRYTIKKLRDLKAADVRVATMFFKPNNFKYDYPIDYKGMNIDNEFIVGYGLDYDQQGRNLPDIYKIIE